ncbi:MAG: Lactamase protein [Ignavibacteria bacterium]|nr:Lactamase protein [Ignavibacteria bacterium]
MFPKSGVIDLIKNKYLSFFALLSLVGCCTFSVPPYKGPVSDHFNGESFYNLDSINNTERNLFSLPKFFLTRPHYLWKDSLDLLPGSAPEEHIGIGKIKVTFVNHASFLIQTDSFNILTDPIWSESVGPLSWPSWKRMHSVGIHFDDLPNIDVVLISHNHYDHLDLPTIEKLKAKFNPLFIVPLGNKVFLEQNDIYNVIELDWWQNYSIREKLPITLVPAKHISMRGICDTRKTLWGGFVINSKKGPIFFAGDTGFGIHFRRIFDKFGPQAVSLLPIGPINPEWFMKEIHMSPSDAATAHKILQSKVSFAMHFGTFAQFSDEQDEAPLELERVLHNEEIYNSEFILPVFGRGYEIK